VQSKTFIRTTPEKLWEALTSAELTKQYHFAKAAFTGKVAAGEHYEFVRPDGGIMLSGTILEANPFSRLEMTFVPGWGEGERKASRNVYEIKPMGNLTKLTVLHFDIPPGYEGVAEGWAQIAASLKTFLETGEALDFSQGAAA
jgi:uncharacterized protein YndB with AHSA1/START domain